MTKIFKLTSLLAIITAGIVFIIDPALAAEEKPKLDTGDTAWLLTSTAIVLLMTIPGVALFYGGMTRKKNVLATLMQSFAITCLVSVIWMVIGYSLAFSKGSNSYVGNFDLAFLDHLTVGAINGTIPDSLFVVFQMTFAIITAALITGAVAERMKFSALMWFVGIWSIVVYSPVTFWVWGGGFLGDAGVLDFAGGTVVHINSGIAALVACIMLGKRKGYGVENLAPHNLVLTVIGGALLWVGWFGFNGGSVLSADPTLVSLVFVTTSLAAAAGALASIFTSMIYLKKPDVSMALNGILAGLVGITAGADSVTWVGAILIGLVAGCIVVFAIVIIDRIQIDDPVGAISVHGVCGLWGTIAVGIFSTNPEHSVGTQIVGTLSYALFAFVTSMILASIVKATIGLRVSAEEEEEGLDMGEHGQPAYADFQHINN